MAVYSKGIDTKRNMVAVTYNLLEHRNASGIKVHDITDACGCTPAAIYRHFKSLDHMIAVSSIRFLDDYMREYGELFERDLDPVTRYMEGWKLFNHYVFQRPDIYHRIFWGQNDESFKDTMKEYFELFPLEIAKHNSGYFYSLFMSDDMRKRDLMVLRLAARQGLVSLDDAEFLSETNPMIVENILRRCIDGQFDDFKVAEQKCNALIEKNIERIC